MRPFNENPVCGDHKRQSIYIHILPWSQVEFAGL